MTLHMVIFLNLSTCGNIVPRTELTETRTYYFTLLPQIFARKNF